MAEVSIELGQQAKDNVVRYIQDKIKHFPRDELRRRSLEYEKAYHLATVNPEEDQLKPKEVEGEKSGYYRYKDLDIGVTKTIAEADHAFYTSTLLSETPIFPVHSNNEFKDAAIMMNAKIHKDQKLQHWETELSQCLRSGSKYNLLAAEVYWSQQEQTTLTSDAEGQADTKQVNWAGNSIRYLSSYNICFDTTVAPDKVATEGDHAGYTETMTQIRLWKYLQRLKSISPDGVYDTEEMWQSANGVGSGNADFEPYYPERVRQDNTSANSGTNWELEFNLNFPDNKGKQIRYRNTYTVWTFYLRIIPSILGFNTPGKDTPQVWKFVIVNGFHLAASFRMDDVHGLLNIVVAQPNPDELGLDVDSPSGQVIPMQQVIKQMLDRAYASLDRAISDRGLYDPNYVNKEDINSRIPDAKIPLRKNTPTTMDNVNAFDRAYKQLPFDTRHIQELFGIISTVMEYAQFSAGINRAQLGHFVKGNKTRAEFDSIMSNANSKQFVRAVMLAMNFFGPIKQIVKTNILQYQGQETAFSAAKSENVEIDPIQIRQASLEFKLLDGLNPKASNLGGEFYQMFIQMVKEIPEFNQKYDLTDIVAHLMQMGAGINIEEYAREEQQGIAPTPTPQDQPPEAEQPPAQG